MRTKIFTVMSIAALVAAAIAAPAAHAAGKGKKKSGPQVVATDEAGDWGANVDPVIAPLGSALGQDFVEASIAMAGKDAVNFIIKLDSLPPWGGWPEMTRYVWSLEVDGEYVELDGKFTNYSRGACDPTSGQCPPPRDPGLQPFMVRGNCTVTQNIQTCEELGFVQAAFATADATITIPVPLELIGAKPGSKITHGSSNFSSIAGGTLVAIPSAFLSLTTFPLDAMQMTGTFVVKSGKKK